MAGFSSNNPSAPITGINVTPLVDITLVLLIVFMVTAKLVVSRSMPMDLPKAATGGEVQQILSVALLPDHSLEVDGKKTPTDAAMIAAAKQALTDHPDIRAVLQADGALPHRQVIHVLDLLRQAGLSKVAFGVQPEAPVE